MRREQRPYESAVSGSGFVLLLLRKIGTDSLQSLLESLSVAGVADAHGALLLEAVPGGDEGSGGLVHLPAEVIGGDVQVIGHQSGGPRPGLHIGKVGLSLHPGVQNGQILPDDAPVPLQQLVRMLQGQGCHRLVQHAAADEVVVPVDAALLQHALVLGGDPPQAHPRQGEHLGHAAHADALLVQVHDGGAVALLLGQVAVHLVAQDVGPVPPGDGNNLLEQGLRHEGPGGVVGVVEADELHAPLRQPGELFRVGQVFALPGQMQQLHLGPQRGGDGVELLIGGQDGDHLVPGLHQGVEQVVVGPRRSVGGDHLLGLHVPVQPADPLLEGGQSEDVPIGEPPGAQLLQKGPLVLAGEGEQLVQGHRVHAGLGDIIFGPHLVLVHPLFYQKRFDVHKTAPSQNLD